MHNVCIDLLSILTTTPPVQCSRSTAVATLVSILYIYAPIYYAYINNNNIIIITS